jgi:hypothetical protein
MKISKKKHVRLRRINWDAEFYSDILNGNGFIITEPAEITVDGSRKKSMYGPQSPLYGTSYEDEQSFIERYRCQCGAFKSRQFEGEICPICGTKVEFKDSNINVTGWISLGDNKIISPYYFNVLQQAIGRNVFPDIIYAKYKVTTDGRVEKPKEDDYDIKPSSVYAGIGVDAFYENYENIIRYFRNQKKNKDRTFYLLLKQKRHVFISHIPIASTLLRPQSVTSDTFYFNSLDKIVNTAFSLSENLKNCIDVEKPYILQRLQTKVNEMWNIYFEELNGKDGLIRGDLLGGSLNFTSRNVIVPDPSLKDNEIDLSYNTFLEVFKYKIIYYIMKLDDITLSKAYAIWKAASTFDSKVYDIMQFIIKQEDVRVLINRNPTLNFYSMLLMKSRQIKPDGNDYALSIPLSILPGLNADFDGDILNIIGMMDKSISYMFRKFDPIRRMIISRDSGLLNDYFSITKGQLIDLYYFSTMGPMENDTPQTYPVLDNKTKELLYVENNEIKKYKSGVVNALDYV